MMRGDVHVLRPPKGVRGDEQAGRRYGVVVQNEDILSSTRLVAPTSTRAQSATYRPEVEILGRSTLVLVEQMRAVDPSRLGECVGRLGLSDMQEIDDALRKILDLR